MNADQTIAWLKKNKPYLNITAIGRDAGVPHLRHILTKNKSAAGHTTDLTDKHLPELNRIINQIKK